MTTAFARLGLLLLAWPALRAADTLDYARDVRPFLETYCLGCHSTEAHKGDLDLERFTTLQEILDRPKVWEAVAEQVSLGEMPPKNQPQPSTAERDLLLRWVGTTLNQAAEQRAGDPGPVVLRRLNNAEYTYTIRDLTGLETLTPVAEFPTDSAAGEGFLNTGQALVMSPALLAKYLDAAKAIVSRAVLLPDGFRFSPNTTRRDWTEEILADIRALYRKYTDARGADRVNLQGIVFDTNEGGRLPVEAYLRAALELRDGLRDGRAGSPSDEATLTPALSRPTGEGVRTLTPALSRPTGEGVRTLTPALSHRMGEGARRAGEGNSGPSTASGDAGGAGRTESEWIGAVAAARSLSPKYLASLWRVLEGTNASPLLEPLRRQWQAARDPEVTALVDEVTRWQNALWKFSSVGHIGKAGGPKAWMERVVPLASSQEFRLRLDPPTNQAPIRIYLIATDAGDGAANDFVVWQRPRLMAPARPELLPQAAGATAQASSAASDPHMGRSALDETNICVQAPSVITLELPASQAAGAEFVVTGTLDPERGREGSVQLQVTTNPPPAAVPAGLLPSETRVTVASGAWTSNNQRVANDRPILVQDGSEARRRFEAAFDEFCEWFPAALCYPKIVPVDEVVTLTLYHREDHHLSRLMLDEAEAARLDRLWEELHYVSQDALALVDAFEQLWQYATQDADPKVFEPMRQPILDRAAAFRRQLEQTQAAHLDALIEFASRAYRRPLTDAEAAELHALYQRLRTEELPHEEAFRLTLARVFVAPAFLYRLEASPPGANPQPVTDWELATRLSYFLWSSLPDAELRAEAAAGRLRDPDVLAAQTRRMLRDARVRRLATEFACVWLHIYDFPSLDEKSERHFPTFAGLRAALYEEAIQFFTDLFQRDGSLLEVFDADHTFLNEALAAHYGIVGVSGPDFRRVDGVRELGRGGVLGLGATLAKQSGASRTSPILRGNWVAEVLLGEKLPRPPPDVPQLPEEEGTGLFSMRELTERHSRDPRCAGCHVRIDGYGFALEGYDAIGRLRTHDLGGHPVDTRSRVFDGTEVEGVAGLRRYLLTTKRDEVLGQFCQKLLGFALGRGVLLSDRPLLAAIQQELAAREYRVSGVIEAIVQSPQFRQVRGRDGANEE